MFKRINKVEYTASLPSPVGWFTIKYQESVRTTYALYITQNLSLIKNGRRF